MNKAIIKTTSVFALLLFASLELQEAQEKKAQENLERRQRFLNEIVVKFKESLKTFSLQHKEEILKHPEFRLKYHALCRSVGIDPLTSTKDWTTIFGVGDFYYQLAVQVVDVCISTRNQNGGIIELSELLSRLDHLRSHTGNISNEDILRAIDKLTILRSGYSIIRVGNQTLIQSLPNELNSDDKSVIELAQVCYL